MSLMTTSRSGHESAIRRRLWGVGAVGCLVVVAGAIAYSRWSAPTQLPPVTVEPPIEMVTALGRLEPYGEVVQVFAPTSLDGARIDRLAISHGQIVRQGEVIAILDTYARRQATLQASQRQLEVAQARLRQVEAGAKAGQIEAQSHVVERLQTELLTEVRAQEAAIARLKAELENAQLEDQRYQRLYQEGAVAASLRDSKRLVADMVQERLHEAEAILLQIRRSRPQQIAEAEAALAAIAEVRPVDVAVAQAEVAEAEANVARAAAELALAVVRSPQDGQVLKIHTRPGEVVGSQGIVSLGQTQQMVAVAEVYELDIGRVYRGQSATIRSKNLAFPDQLKGTVVEVGLEIGKQDVLNTDPAAQFDARVVEVKVLLDQESSRKVAGLTNLSIDVAIDVRSPGESYDTP